MLQCTGLFVHRFRVAVGRRFLAATSNNVEAGRHWRALQITSTSIRVCRLVPSNA